MFVMCPYKTSWLCRSGHELLLCKMNKMDKSGTCVLFIEILIRYACSSLKSRLEELINTLLLDKTIYILVSCEPSDT
jgi:hypothetical protein